jgi:hypothetical protein
MSAFDPATFLDATLTEPTEKRNPLPIGDYNAIINDVTARAWTGKKDPTKSGIAWDLVLIIDVPADVQTETELSSTLQMKDSIMLDLTPGGTIDGAKGKNRRLRAYREAVDLNKVGDSFSARSLIGKMIKVKIAHEIWEGNPVEQITGVIKA